MHSRSTHTFSLNPHNRGMRVDVPLPNAADIGKPAFVLRAAVSPAQCLQLVKLAEEQGFESDEFYFEPQGGQQTQACSRALLTSDSLAASLYSQVREDLPDIDGRVCCGLSENFRFLRYDSGEAFLPHTDGPSEKADEVSLRSLILYLNSAGDAYEGGLTRFVSEGSTAGSVEPRVGDVLVFQHDLLHEGLAVTRGRKYICRTDVMYRRDA